ncbi:PREDICTED: uncharacterized protein LOC109581905 [Amphimedon queenslandica]|uniref:IgGFc-binding protein N-terminal domain-containing protein n=1 Tax=Amphimedon queenslandica TaxID=400682 RepID=A0A1X7UWZ1_AMPQE|nr:PREDICTED: uncharacterized protein LOC109581905 [Amphimedon queenslandica]|eukprot:XP_019851939.1 PREDICTED: uncharacterized protein LOC109581905 [Amphimedon queenslandica]
MVACHLEQYLVLLLLLIVTATSSGTTLKDQNSDSFFVALPRNRHNFINFVRCNLHVVTDETEPVNVSIDAGAYFQSNFILPPFGNQTVRLPSTLIVVDNTNLDKAIHVFTNDGKKIKVYSSSVTQHGHSGAAYTAIPLLDYEIEEYTYYVISTSSSASAVRSETLLVTGLSSANITITPTQDVMLPPFITGLPDDLVVLANEMYEFNMPPSTTLLLNSVSDMSGTKITSNVPIAVICSHMCAEPFYGEQLCDHFLFQSQPTIAWGSTFMSQPIFSSGSVYKFISSEDNATVAVTCSDNSSLSDTVAYYNMSAGQLKQIVVASQSGYCTFVSDSKILVVQFAGASGISGLGDPCSVALTPIEHYTKVTNPLSLPSFPYLMTDASPYTTNALIIVQSSYDVSNLTVSLNNSVVSSPWVPVFAGQVIIGYSTKLVNISGSNENKLYFNREDLPPMYVIVNGLVVTIGYCFSLNTGLDVITEVSRPKANFSSGSYFMSEETSETLILNRYNQLNETVVLQLRQCGGNSLPENFVLSESNIEFTEGVAQTNVTLTVNSDGELSHHIQCFCLELVQRNELFSYYRPYATSNVCVQDNEDVSLVASNAIINSTLLRLRLTLSGYNGNMDQTVTVRPRLEYLSNQSSGGSAPVLPTINVYITKYVSTYTYSLRLSEPLLLDSVLYIDLYTQSNISINTTSKYGPLLIIPSDSSSATPTSTVQFPTTTFTVATPPLIESLKQNPEVFISFLSILAVLLLIIIIFLVLLVLISCRLYKQSKTVSFVTKERKELEATNTSATVQGSTMQPVVDINRESLYSTASDSIVHNTINTTDSPSRHSVSPPACHSSCDKLVESNV